MRLLITGSRFFDDYDVMDKAMKQIRQQHGDEVVLVHGGAAGADVLSGRFAHKYGWEVEEHKANWKRFGPSAGPIRNQEMVDAGADLCLAFPRGESRGTRHCMQAAKDAGIPVQEW